MDEAARKAIGQAIKEHIAREGLSREEFCFRFKIAKGTLDKMVTGLFSDKTLIKFERNVGRSFRDGAASFERAAPELGGYLHADYRDREGYYTLARPAFGDAGRIWLFPVRIEWKDSRPGLRISGKSAGTNENTYEKMAYIAFPKNCPYMFVHANEKGWQSTMVFSLVDAGEAMHGALLTLGDTGGALYAPFCLPVILEKAPRPLSKPLEISIADEAFGRWQQRLAAVFAQKYVRLTSIAPAP
jgi:hypothetical protein